MNLGRLSKKSKTGTIENQPIALSVSVGRACFPEDGMDIDSILDCTDRSMNVNSPPPNRRWLRFTARSRIDRPCGRLHHVEIVVWFRRLLLLDVSLPHLIRYIATCCYPVPARPQMLAPIPFPKSRVFA